MGSSRPPPASAELYSERMKLAGLDPLPAYIPPLEDPQTRPDLAASYPLQLLSPPRPQFLNSTFANSPTHRSAAGDPTVELSAEDARARGLVDGQWAEVYNSRGTFRARVALTGAVRPGVAVATGLYWNKLVPGLGNANTTTSTALTDMGRRERTFFGQLWWRVRALPGESGNEWKFVRRSRYRFGWHLARSSREPLCRHCHQSHAEDVHEDLTGGPRHGPDLLPGRRGLPPCEPGRPAPGGGGAWPDKVEAARNGSGEARWIESCWRTLENPRTDSYSPTSPSFAARRSMR